MANDICASVTFQVLARESFFVMKQLKIDKGKTDLIRFYLSRLFPKVSNRWWTQAINTKYQIIKKHKKIKETNTFKEHLRLGRKFNSVFLVQRVGVETADHLCFRTSAWTDCHSLFQRGAWFTPRQHLEASDQVWRSETRQLLRLSTNYERAHFKRTDEWRQSATIIYYFKLPKSKREEE